MHRRLIFVKIDKDQDGSLTLAELTDWIRHVQLRYVTRDTDRQWKDYDSDGNLLHLKWGVYLERTYGHKEDDITKRNICFYFLYYLIL